MNFKKAHFIGIAGKGMSATALLLREAGVTITGSDEGFYPPVSDYLAQAGIAFAEGYKKENIPADADIIVIGKNAKLVPETNEEVQTAFESTKKVVSFPDILNELTKGKETIVVTGSYGKSTTTALLAWCLQKAGKDPSYFIGEVTKGFDAYAYLGKGDVFVLEGDEYPSANWDPTSKFLHYNAQSVVLTSATHDHVNVFPTHEEYLKPFRTLMLSLPPDGTLVVNQSERFAKDLSKLSKAKVFYYSRELEGGWHAANIAYGTITTFDLMHGVEKIASLTTKLLGAHNIENIVGASAMLLSKKLLTPEELAKGIASFEGVKRRMELLTTNSPVPVYEGFGSSYDKAKSAMDAMKLHYPTSRLVVVFEPHTFTWRNRASLPQYDTVFAGANKVYIYEPAQQGATTHEQLTQSEIVERVQAAGFDAEAIQSADEALTKLTPELKPGDAVLLLTSGDLGGLIKSLPAALDKKFSA
jgi:UDP-N-acetylmuramate: L-alanyl-gamma-D-glutamyl-meso-diaminopimelate ligase